MRQRVKMSHIGALDTAIPTSVSNILPPVKTAPVNQGMSYNRAERNANFFLDLLADKMDVLQRKAEMYMRLGEKDALAAIQKSWSALHATYNALLDPKMSRSTITTFKTNKGEPVSGDIMLRRIQSAMDNADRAMRLAGDISLKNRVNTQGQLMSQVAKLNAEVSSLNTAIEQCNAVATELRAKIRVLNDENAMGLANKDEEIQNLLNELSGEQARSAELQNAKAMCEDQISQLSAEIEDLKEPLVLQSSAFTAGGAEGSDSLTLDFTNRAAVVDAIGSRDSLIKSLREDAVKQLAETAKNIQNAELLAAKKAADAERQAAEAAENADKMKKYAIGALILGAITCGGVYYYSRK